jgi:hypothetical protein
MSTAQMANIIQVAINPNKSSDESSITIAAKIAKNGLPDNKRPMGGHKIAKR